MHVYTLKTEPQYPEVMSCDMSKLHTTHLCLPTQPICAALYQKRGKRCNIGESLVCFPFTLILNRSSVWVKMCLSL